MKLDAFWSIQSDMMPPLRMTPARSRLWQVETSTLLSEASKALETSKSKAIDAEAQASIRRFGFRARMSASFGTAVDSGSAEVSLTSSASSNSENKASALYQTYVQARRR